MSEAKAVGVSGYHPDTDILEHRLQMLGAITMEMTEKTDFNALDMARDRNVYWRVLNAIVARIRDGAERAA
jgi:hypothetical protein